MPESSEELSGRIRPMLRLCRERSCPCWIGTCQVESLLMQYEIEAGGLSSSLEEIRKEVMRKCGHFGANSAADTVDAARCRVEEKPRAGLDLEAFKLPSDTKPGGSIEFGKDDTPLSINLSINLDAYKFPASE